MHEENLEFYFLKTVFERHSENTLRTAEDGLGINGAQQQRHAPCYHIELYPVHHYRTEIRTRARAQIRTQPYLYKQIIHYSWKSYTTNVRG